MTQHKAGAYKHDIHIVRRTYALPAALPDTPQRRLSGAGFAAVRLTGKDG